MDRVKENRCTYAAAVVKVIKVRSPDAVTLRRPEQTPDRRETDTK